MFRFIKRLIIVLLLLLGAFALAVFFAAHKEVPEHITYGISFNTPYAEELGLPPREVYNALLDDLGVRHLRLAAHWDMVEPVDDEYDFSELDYQLNRAEEVGADVIFGVGRRLPRWPECHVPAWAEGLSWDEQKEEIKEYIEVVVERYKDRSPIIYWQVENEPFLEVFAFEHCGSLDTEFLDEEVALVRSLDGTRPILMTDSGNLGTWAGAYKRGDAFGTSMYIYFWTPELGQFKTILPPWFYRMKEGIMELLYGEKPTFVIELSAEPWLIAPIAETDVEIQYQRMNINKFNEIIEYAKESRFERQYLWGGEWWYWLDKNGHPEMWDRAEELFTTQE